MSNHTETMMTDVTALGEAVCASAKDVMYIIDKAGIVKTGNDRLWSELGLTKSQTGHVSLLASIVEDERSIALRTWHTELAHKKSERFIRKFKTAKGELKVYSVVESPIVADNSPSTIVGVARDISEDTAIEEKLWSAQEQTQATLEYAVRASMGLIKGYIFSLQKLDSMPAGSRDRFSKIIAEEIDTMGRNVENILSCRGTCQSNSEECVFDLVEAVSESIDFYKSESERRQIPLRFEKPKREISFFGQPLTVSRIVCSLINCALLRITHSGEIHIEIRDCDEYVEIIIGDTGCAVPQEQVDEIMSKASKSGKQDNGTLGSTFDFNIARLLADAMGGGVIPRSGEKAGLEFTVMLPRSLYTAIQTDSCMTAGATSSS